MVIPTLASGQSCVNKEFDVEMGAVDSPIWQLHIMDLVLRIKWEVVVAQIRVLPGPKGHCLLPLSALVPRLGRESLGLRLDHWVILVGVAASCCKVH